MNRTALLALLAGLAALVLAFYCFFLQIIVRKDSTESAVATVEWYVKRDQLPPQEVARLDHALATIRWNDRTALQARFNLWVVGSVGFLLLGIANLFLAVRVGRKENAS